MTSWCVFDLPQLDTQVNQLQRTAEDPNLWQDPTQAQLTMQTLSRLQQDLDGWRGLEKRVEDAVELAGLDDEDLRGDLDNELASILKELDLRETQTWLSGPYDRENAILAIHAGAGGTDSQDWAAMLQRMYLRWADSRKLKAEILDSREGEEAGIKSATIAIEGEFAYGYLRSEKGVHRLVRLSPFDSAKRRHTSFVLIEVLPHVQSDEEVVLNASDLRIDTFRAAGAGGQNVQKNETAIRITHLPTGIVVTCQNERSQTQNKENAMRVLRARLLVLKQQEQQEELAQIKGDHIKAEWGRQIRSYVLHPYQMVKDHRTNIEIGDASAVLDGDLDALIEAYLRSTVGQSVS